MLKDKKWQTIKCPHCGREYSPGEIFMPEDLTGRPRTVVRDPDGEILCVEWEDGGEPVLSQTFVCDGCGRPFAAEAAVSYSAKPLPEEEDFSSEEVSLL